MRAIFMPDKDLGALAIPWILKEIYIDKCYEVLRDTKNLTILDIGANIGLVTDFMRPHAKKLYAVEPAPDAFDALTRNAEGWDNVEMFNFAISDRDGEMEMALPESNTTMGSLMIGDKVSKPGEIETYKVKWTDDLKYSYVQPLGPLIRMPVPTKRLDTFFSENQIGRVDFMKLDVEGAEELILRGEGFLNVAPKIGCILVEFHYPNWMDLAAKLVNLGYAGHRLKTEADVYIFNRA